MNDNDPQSSIDQVTSLVLIGANHRSSTMGLRDRLFVEDQDVAKILHDLRDQGIDEAMVLSTCDRTEIVAVGRASMDVAHIIKSALANHGQVDHSDMERQLYLYMAEDVINHLFLVAASLDSQIVGEPQVLGQVKASHQLAKNHGMIGPCLDGVMQAAFSVAKKIRSDTSVGERPVSIAAAAENIVDDVHGDLKDLRALLIGVGEMGELVATRFLNNGLHHLTIMHPLERRAGMLARKLECHVADMDELPDVLATADVIITALGKRHPVLDSDKVVQSLKRRRQRLQLIIDTGIPGDVDAAVNRIDNCYLYDLADLERIALHGRSERVQQALHAHEIVGLEASQFILHGAERRAVPALKELRDHFGEIREQVLLEAGVDAEKATRLMMNKILHTPMEKLRGLAAHQPSELKMAELAIRRLFGLKNKSHDNADETKPGNTKKEP